MKLLILPDDDYTAKQDQTHIESYLELLLNSFNYANSQTQSIEFNNEPFIQSQLDSTLDNLDIDLMLDPAMLNTGGMEVMASIKRKLRDQIETLLITRDT